MVLIPPAGAASDGVGGRGAAEQPWPNDRPARVTLVLKSGTTLEAVCMSAQGGPDRPFTPAEILAKLRATAGPVYPNMGDTAEALIGLDPDTRDGRFGELLARMTGAPEG